MDTKLRVATPDDAEACLAIYAPYVTGTAITFEYEVPGVDEFRSRMVDILATHPYLVAERDGHVVGYAYAHTFKARAAYDWAVETTVYVDRGERGGGIGRLLYQGLEGALALQGVLNAEACIAVPDQGGSVGFHEHLGYRMVGTFKACGYKFDTWWDMVWMEKFLGQHTVPTRPVTALPQLAGELQDLLDGLNG